jgi:hypothetical protein
LWDRMHQLREQGSSSYRSHAFCLLRSRLRLCRWSRPRCHLVRSAGMIIPISSVKCKESSVSDPRLVHSWGPLVTSSTKRASHATWIHLRNRIGNL